MSNEYTLEQKEQALAYVYALGTIAAASRMSGIPSPTIHAWLKALQGNPEADEVRMATRAKIVADAWGAVFIGITKMRDAISRIGVENIDPAKMVEISERASRVLKNIGAVAEKYEHSFDMGDMTALIEASNNGGFHRTNRIDELTAQSVEAEN